MIGCQISGGLGNQFFRYAVARAFMERRKATRKEKETMLITGLLDTHGVSGNLYDFNIVEHVKCDDKRLVMAHGSVLQRLVFVSDKALRKLFNRIGISCFKHGYNDLSRKLLAQIGLVSSYSPDTEPIYLPSSNVDKVFTFGSFEKVDYFFGIENVLKKEFTPVHPCLKANEKLYQVIRNTNSVCLAIRRGDFMNNVNKKIFYVCDLEYFQRGVDYIKKHVENPVFIVFTNDIDWVKANLNIDSEVYFESGKDPVWETFRLMYSCKHFVISNSTLHWWAQWRSENKEKIVVAPERWYNDPSWNEHLMLDYFVRMPTGVKNPYVSSK